MQYYHYSFRKWISAYTSLRALVQETFGRKINSYLFCFREAYVIFSGGTTYDQAGRTPSITVIHSKTTTVLEMEHNVVDFITLCESPWSSGKIIV